MNDMSILWKLKQLLLKDDVEFIVELYRELLDRDPDPEGFRHHLSLLRSGVPKITLVISIMRSEEAIRLYQRS
ncbi:DUF4214 domain-containing protein [Brevibacillus sp. B_LB10_24]|uniref:DUF4214 domain-containing protein n=1 Tax=Brevibacillus sp. B_LB10_24 TaxID=3380645 RepID=UPI0038B784C5